MGQIGIALVALAVGIGVGAVLVALRKPRTSGLKAGDTPLAVVEARLEAQSAELRRIADSAVNRDLAGEQLRAGLDGARRALEELSLREQERREADVEGREVVRRLSTVLAGGASKGRAGENVLREHLAQLPPGMLVTDLRVGGKVVEFGMQLSDGRRLPIDSKWTALAELEALEAADDPVTRDACARDVERAVAARAKEVAQYLDPAVTSQVAVAAVPDAAYAVLKRAHADAWSKGVVIVPYSSALPIVLFLYSLVQRFGDSADVQSSLAEVSSALEAMGAVVENKLTRAATMLTNGADELRSNLGKARGSIARAGTASAPASDPPELGESSAHGRLGERFAGLNSGYAAGDEPLRSTSCSSSGTAASGPGSDAISSRMRSAASRACASRKRAEVASRTVRGVARTASRTTPTPSCSHRCAFGSWSAPIGSTTSGRPCASAPITLPDPPWLTTRSQWGSRSDCGTYRSTCTLSGCGPNRSGSRLRPTVTITVAGSSRSPASTRSKRSPDSWLKIVPSVK